DPVGCQLAALHAPRDRTGGLRDVLAAAVAHRQNHGHALVVARRRDARPQRLADRGRAAAQAADRLEAVLVPHHLPWLAPEVLAEECLLAGPLGRRLVSVSARE